MKSSSSSLTRGHGLALLALLAALALTLHGPIAQWPGYHQFADQRSWGWLPHAADVLSNIPFALIGLWGCARIPNSSSAWPWRLFAAAIAMTSLGSAWYHWAPNNMALVFDRLPIAWACAALLCAFLAERVDLRWGQTHSLVVAWLVATVSVLWWRLGDLNGQGDLRLYVWVQFLPMLLVPAALMMRLAPFSESPAVPASAWVAALALYATAKLAESADHAILDTLGFLSGHTLKHLIAAGAAAWLLRAAISSGSRR